MAGSMSGEAPTAEREWSRDPGDLGGLQKTLAILPDLWYPN